MADGRADARALSSFEGTQVYRRALVCQLLRNVLHPYVRTNQERPLRRHCRTCDLAPRAFLAAGGDPAEHVDGRLPAVGSAVLGGDARLGHHRRNANVVGSPSEAMMGASSVAPRSTSFAQTSASSAPGVSRFHGQQMPHPGLPGPYPCHKEFNSRTVTPTFRESKPFDGN